MTLACSNLIDISPSMRHRMSTRHVRLQPPNATLRVPQKPSKLLQSIATNVFEKAAAGGMSLAAALLLVTAPPALAKEDIFGPAKVVDGDTLVVDGTRIRMFGIDAPETKQSCDLKGKNYTCGLSSKAALEKEIAGAPVRCEPKQKDLYGRTVAICRLAPPGSKSGEGEDINAWMVSEGWAVAYKRYSKAYVPLEEAARNGKKGIWAGTFQQPDIWRKEHPRNGAAPAPEASAVASLPSPGVSTAPTAALAVAAVPLDPSSDCVIKGNISSKGEKVYHMPGGKYYDATKIDKANERWFCNEKEAVAAGWRAAKG